MNDNNSYEIEANNFCSEKSQQLATDCRSGGHNEK